MEKLFTTFEVARICQVSPASVSRWIRGGKLASSVTAGGHHRVGAEALRIFLGSLRIPIPAELTSFAARRVLIVDADAKTRRMIRNYLERMDASLRVEEGENGFEAGWKAHAFEPGLVILDCSVIPKVAGGEKRTFLKGLADSEKTLILLTGTQNELNNLKKYGSERIRAMIPKPFDTELLKQKLREYLYEEGKEHARIA